MEASLPISAAVRPEPARAPAAAAFAGTNPLAPSVLLPLRFMVAGLGALVTGMVLLVVRPEILATYHYNQYVIATTHLFVLGWISTIVMGAMYQLVPVALETKLYSERLARWQFVFHLVGFSGMVWTFWHWNLKQVGHFGAVLAVGVGLFVYNIARTLVRVPRWNVVATSVASALTWLGLAVVAGLLVVIGKCSYEPETIAASTGFTHALLLGLNATAGVVRSFDTIGAMHAHAHLGAMGVFIMLIVGISYKLVPMFTLSELQNRRRAAASLWLLNLGLAGAFITILLRSSWKPAFAFVATAGLVCYGLEIRAIVQARKRRAPDWGVTYFLTAIGLLAPLVVLAAVLSSPHLPFTALSGQAENLYGFLAFVGVVSFAIIGMLYKILPFLAWYASYSKHIGRCKVPSLADLYSPRVQAAGYWTYLGGLAVTSVAILAGNGLGVRCGGGLLLASLGLLALNVGKILGHLLRPKLQPLAARPATKGIA